MLIKKMIGMVELEDTLLLLNLQNNRRGTHALVPLFLYLSFNRILSYVLYNFMNVLNNTAKIVSKFSYCVQCSTLYLFSPDSKDQEFLLGLRKDFVAMQERLDSHLNYRIRRLLRLDVALPCIEFLHLNPVTCTHVSYTLIVIIDSWYLFT